MLAKKVVIVSDLHSGSRYGLTPPSWWNGHTMAATKWLWECWTHFINRVGKHDLLIINGDPIDGKQRRSTSVGLLTASLDEQVDIAIECLAPLVKKAGKVIRIEGTAYHESFDGPCSKMDVTFGIKIPSGPARIVRDIRLSEDAILNVKHQPEGEGALYRGTTMDRELLWATVTQARKGIAPATHIVRSHLHSDAHMRGFGIEINFTPCWCLQQPYALHKRRYRWVPDIGGAIMLADSNGHHGYSTHALTYPVPQPEADSYEEI